MDKKNRGYVSPEMDVILLERGDVVCDLSRMCVHEPGGTPLGDNIPIEHPCPPDDSCVFDNSHWGED